MPPRKKAPLRAVAPDEKPPDAKPLSVVEAAEAGNHRALLAAMQTRIAVAVQNPNTPPRDLAALTRRLHEIANDIAAIDAAAGEGDDLGEASRTPDEEFDGELTPDAL